MSHAHLATVVINGDDIEPLIAFWKAFLEVEEASRFPGFVWLQPQAGSGVGLAFQHVVEEKETRRNRLHLDLGVDDLDGATARVIELGGSQVEEHRAGDFTWRVMQDPGGNEFCLAPHG